MKWFKIFDWFIKILHYCHLLFCKCVRKKCESNEFNPEHSEDSDCHSDTNNNEQSE